MENSVLIIVLALGTLVVVMLLGFIQITKVRHSQHKRGEKPGGVAGPDPN